MRFIAHSLFVFFLTLAFGLKAQQLRFKHVNGEDGLSSNMVRCVMQDDLGFIWIGTQDGLNRYDAYQIRSFRYDHKDSTSLSCSDVTALLQVRHDLILIGTIEGLNFFNPITEKFSVPLKKEPRLQMRINTLCKMKDGNVLVGTAEGLYSLNCEKATLIKSYFKNDKIHVSAVEQIGDDCYVGTIGAGLWKITKGNINKVELSAPDFDAEQIKLESLQSITHIGHYGGKLYLGTTNAGVYKIDNQNEVLSHLTYTKLHPGCDIVNDFSFRNNRIFVATAKGLVVDNLLNDESTLYTRSDQLYGLYGTSCTCIYSDNENNFWIGTESAGVNVSFYRSQKFPISSFNFERELIHVNCFSDIDSTRILVGGELLLEEVNIRTGQRSSHTAVLGDAPVITLYAETPDIFWIGTEGNGLLRYNRAKKEKKWILDGQSAGIIHALYRDGDYLFAGSVGNGLFSIRLSDLTVQHFGEKEGLPNQNIKSIFKDSKGQAWLGTYDGGLLMFSSLKTEGRLELKKVYQNKGKEGQIAANRIMAVNEDKNGAIWVATSSGLSRLMPGDTFRNFYNRNGLANTYLYSLLQDSTGKFWMSTKGGIISFNPIAPLDEIIFRNYNMADGLLNNEMNKGAAYASTSGRMYFGGANGFNIFRPSTIRENLKAPEAYVIAYKRSGTDVPTDSIITYKKHLRLKWTENYFQFEMAAINYVDPSKNKFRYKLEGYDQDWSAPTNVRFVSYTELPGGDYVFKVKAANNDGIWHETPFEIHITVVPPFWKTKIFYLLVFLALFALVYLFIHLRTRRFIRENRLLEYKVAERTRELEEKNRDITSSIQYAKRIQEAILPSKEHIFNKLKKAFILYMPKDIVSGDFYWFSAEKHAKIFAVVDCTGHGVPGAFMSMIGHNLLHQIVSEKEITEPGEILNQLHKGVNEALRQGRNEVQTNDGMDVSIISIHNVTGEVKWAGANRPLIVIDTEKNLTRHEGDKFPIGGSQVGSERHFTTRTIKAEKGSWAYMFTDGYSDQFGGDRGKKFMAKRLHVLLSEIHLLSAEEQRQALKSSFDDWKENHEQVDDVLIAGIALD